MKRPVLQMLSIFILIAILLTACGGEATTVPPQIEQPTEVPEDTEAPEAAEASMEEKPAEEQPSAPAESKVELPAVNPADYPSDVG